MDTDSIRLETLDLEPPPAAEAESPTSSEGVRAWPPSALAPPLAPALSDPAVRHALRAQLDLQARVLARAGTLPPAVGCPPGALARPGDGDRTAISGLTLRALLSSLGDDG